MANPSNFVYATNKQSPSLGALDSESKIVLQGKQVICALNLVLF